MLRRIPSRLTLLLIAAASFASPVSAAPINYQESVNGDLSGDTPLTVFTLDTGVNTVSGTCGCSFSVNSPGDPDSFAFIVPAGSQVASGNVSIPTKTGFMINADWQLRAGSAQALGGTFRQTVFVDTPGSLTFSAVPLLPGTYNITQTGWTGNGPGDATANYTFTFNVAPVPEPASIGLLALSPLVACARRRHLPLPDRQ